ncbi:hypothetical protein [Thioalkalivibrio sp. XN279]|uniref:hypothetical protein n=1 Tax=Thioalkalivibrio sp. XN279 TaxID=2714953 RepID=UPI00140A00B4|nr:hypothetical protein [Thioalkalivibrio sp. XN279]NHA15418.1 hypothetical protein [Thioalkalivibrio sp. XN279]
MAEDARLAYLQARLQARHGDRPSADDWRVAEASADLSHFLEAVRRTALKRWIGDVNPDMAPDAIERYFRAAWRGAVDEVADWSPEDWRDAVAWLCWLPDLPAVEHLLRGLKIPPWMREDPVLKEVAFEDPQRRLEAFSEQPLAPLLEGNPEGDPEDATLDTPPDPDAPRVAARWVAEWRRRLPRGARAHRDELAALLEQVQAHLEAMRTSAEPDGRALRNTLSASLARRFRKGAGTVTALFSHLLLDGLELERVRAGVMARRLLPERPEGRTWA